MKNAPQAFGWVGAMGLSIAPFFITTHAGLILAVISLVFLCVQTIDKKLHNLTLVQLCGIVGYSFAYWSL